MKSKVVGKKKDVVANDQMAYSLAKVAVLINVNLRTVIAHANAGTLRTRYIGRRRLVLREDLAKFLSKDQPSVEYKPINGRRRAGGKNHAA